MNTTYPTFDAAKTALLSEGFADRGERFTKRSRVDPACGGYETLAIVTVEHRKVDPQYGAPDFYEIQFH